MRRVLAIGAAIAGLSGGLPAAASAAAPGRGDPGSAARARSPATVTARCRPARRWYAATATMRAITGTDQLQVRFNLQARPAGAPRFEPVSGTGLGVWRSPTSPPSLGRRPGDVWRVTQPVADLARRSSYRFRVDFRWVGADGAVLRRLHRLSRPCEIRSARYPSAHI